MNIACLGILIADIFASPIDSLPAAGELRLVDRYLMSAGGCAANTAACLRRLGHNVKVIGKVGSDLLGDFVLKNLEQLEIDASAVKRSPDHPTSNTYILNVRGEDRRYLHCVGANQDFRLSDVDADYLEGCQALYVGGYMMMPGFGAEDMAALLREAKRRGIKTVLDVVIGAGATKAPDQVKEVLPWTDLFLPNNDEAALLTGKKDPEEQASALALLNPQCTVVITMGRNGSVVRRGSMVLHAPAYQVSSLDESGAGDAFAAGFLTGMLAQWSPDQTLRFASAVGASCTRALGCTEGVFRFNEAVDFIRQNELNVTTTDATDHPIERKPTA